MDPNTKYTLATQRIASLHAEAAAERLAHVAREGKGSGRGRLAIASMPRLLGRLSPAALMAALSAPRSRAGECE